MLTCAYDIGIFGMTACLDNIAFVWTLKKSVFISTAFYIGCPDNTSTPAIERSWEC